MEGSPTRAVVMEGSHALAAGEGERGGRSFIATEERGVAGGGRGASRREGRRGVAATAGEHEVGGGEATSGRSRDMEGGEHEGATTGGRDMRRR